MSVDIPSTDVIRHWVAWGVVDGCLDDFMEHDAERVAQFDRWLAEVRADAWEEGYTHGLTDMVSSMTPNPYRQGEGSENSNSQPAAETPICLNRQGEEQ